MRVQWCVSTKLLFNLVPSSLLLFHGSTSDSAIPPCSREGDPEGARECCPVSTVKEVATPCSKAFSHRRRRVAIAGSPSPRSIPFTEQQSYHGAAVQSPTRLQWPSQSNSSDDKHKALLSVCHQAIFCKKQLHNVFFGEIAPTGEDEDESGVDSD
ncbi:uncharacterized protein DS421_11g337480 [Arachis hypogaea]|nr:uncharacterized protein DS421_11g337480 [Arachis hypogaea]